MSTAAQVGGFVGSVTNKPNGTATYQIDNEAGRNSFVLHLTVGEQRRGESQRRPHADENDLSAVQVDRARVHRGMQVTKAMGKVSATATLCALVLMLIGCRRVEQRELYGSYVAEYKAGVSTLSLEPGGTFVQVIEVPGRDRVTNRGRWVFRAEKGTLGEVWLDDCLVLHDGFGRLEEAPRRGVCVEPVDREYLFAGRILLGVSDMHPHVKRDTLAKSQR